MGGDRTFGEQSRNDDELARGLDRVLVPKASGAEHRATIRPPGHQAAKCLILGTLLL